MKEVWWFGFFSITATIIGYAIVFLLFIGWGINVYKFAASNFEEPYINEVVRGVGIPIPLIGGIVGWIDIKD